MKFDFSIESSIDKIQNKNTKEFFIEVYQTFANGNYRSSTVMLYSVLICDLIYKLRDLRDIYSDSKASKILSEIEQLQINNPTSAEWESKLIEAIKTRTSLLESSDIVAIESLQKFRHLSAHPVLNSADLLYSPNRDTVQALIRNIVEGIFTNPPFFSNRIFDTILFDLSEIKALIPQDEDLKKYLTSRYLSRLKINDFKKIFRSLWKVVFITDDELSRANGNINYRALQIFVANNRSVCEELIKSEPHYYSNITKDDMLTTLVHFLSSFPQFYSVLEEPLKILIQPIINDEGDMQFMAWFVKNSFIEHISTLDVHAYYGISENAFMHMLKLADENSCKTHLLDFAIKYFGSSPSFDDAQKRFRNIIAPNEELFSLPQIKKLLERSDRNGQIIHSFGMRSKVKNIASRFQEELDKEEYPNIYD